MKIKNSTILDERRRKKDHKPEKEEEKKVRKWNSNKDFEGEIQERSPREDDENSK